MIKSFNLCCTALIMALIGLVACSSSKNAGESGSATSATVTSVHLLSEPNSGLRVSNGLQVNYTVDSSLKNAEVRFVAPSKDVSQQISVSVSNGILIIKTKNGKSLSLTGSSPVITVKGPALTTIEGSSGCLISFSNKKAVKSLTVKGSSGCVIALLGEQKCENITFSGLSGCTMSVKNLVATTTVVNVSSGATVSLNGSSDKLDLTAGSGAIASFAGGFKVHDADIKTSTGAIVNYDSSTVKSAKTSSSSGSIINVK